MITVADCVRVLERHYDPAWAQSWDAVGLVTGDRSRPVERVLLAIDPVLAVAEEALDLGADLVVAHHPLFLRGVHGVSADRPGGRVVRALARRDIALYVAHTNADCAPDGVATALASAIGLQDTVVLGAPYADELDALAVFVPTDHRDRLLDALAAAGAGAVGDYDRCAWWTAGTGTFRPLEGSNPTIGSIGEIERVDEDRLEVVLPRRRRQQVITALREAHPYEEPAFTITETVGPSDRGHGRVGSLAAPLGLRDLVSAVTAALPETATGVRLAAPDPAAVVRRVAVSPGAGDDSVGDALGAGAEVLVTSDMRHHRTRDAVDAGLAIVEVSHWAGEWPWLQRAADLLTAGLASAGNTVEAVVSTIVTDPWT